MIIRPTLRLLCFPVALAALLTLTAAQAATPAFTVSWSPPTQFTDGTAITGPITYQIYVGASGKETKFGNPVTAPPYIVAPTPPVGTTLCVQVTATVGGIESAPSVEACATVMHAPNAPTATTAVIK